MASPTAAVATRGRAWLAHPVAEVRLIIRARMRAHARKQIAFALATVKPMELQFPGRPVWEAYDLCRRARSAILRDAAQRGVDIVVGELTGAAAVVGYLVASLLILLPQGQVAVWDFTGMFALLFVMFPLALVPKVRFLLGPITVLATVAPPILIVAVATRSAWVDAHFAWLTMRNTPGSPHQIIEQMMVGVLLLMCALVASNVGTWGRSKIRHHMRVNAMGATPYDRLIYSWAKAVRAVQISERTWPSTRAMRYCDHQLRELWTISHEELRSTYAGIASGGEQAAEEDAARVSSSIQHHRMLLLSSGPGPVRSAVLLSLQDGLACVIEGDRGRLTENLPPLSRRVRLLDRLKRFAPGTVLLGAGLVLPMLSPIAQDSGLAGNLRITLLVMAVLSLVSAPENVSGKIEDLLDRAMPWKKD